MLQKLKRGDVVRIKNEKNLGFFFFIKKTEKIPNFFFGPKIRE